MNRIAKLEKIMLIKMRKYGIQSSILTMLRMKRKQLVTKEKVKAAAEGKLKNDRDWTIYGGSVNDDLERFLTDLQSQKKVKFEFVYSFFTPKLTDDELKLVQEGNEEHLKSYLDYFYGKNPDVDDKEMKESDFKSKYVHGDCLRITIPLRLGMVPWYYMQDPNQLVGPPSLVGPGWSFKVNKQVREDLGRFSYFSI